MLQKILSILGLKRTPRASIDLYALAVGEARQEWYYETCSVPDTIDGRFDMITLVVSLVIERTSNMGGDIGQGIFDAMFADMDANLREIGVSDEGMKYKIRSLASGFMGRMRTFTAIAASNTGNRPEEALRGEWENAISRNVFRLDGGIHPGAKPLAGRVMEINTHLAGISDDDVRAGAIDFPAIAER